MRAVQRKLDLLTLSLEGRERWDEVARAMPTTTLGRLNYLADTGVIDPGTARDAGEAYAWFLQRYHHIQENYKQHCKPAVLPYDPEAFNKYRQDIERLVAS